METKRIHLSHWNTTYQQLWTHLNSGLIWSSEKNHVKVVHKVYKCIYMQAELRSVNMHWKEWHVSIGHFTNNHKETASHQAPPITQNWPITRLPLIKLQSETLHRDVQNFRQGQKNAAHIRSIWVRIIWEHLPHFRDCDYSSTSSWDTFQQRWTNWNQLFLHHQYLNTSSVSVV